LRPLPSPSSFCQRAPPHTELLDLDPLPLSALRDPSLEALYAGRFTHFNPIQTQARLGCVCVWGGGRWCVVVCVGRDPLSPVKGRNTNAITHADVNNPNNQSKNNKTIDRTNQAFHALYHTDASVLVGAPTGSGKTVTSELAMFRLWRAHPGDKVCVRGVCLVLFSCGVVVLIEKGGRARAKRHRPNAP
jgi:hypothetical protein